MVDTRGEKNKTILDVLVIWDFLDELPKDLSWVPPERQEEFKIDLIQGVAPIAKTPYYLAPPEMQELSTQL